PSVFGPYCGRWVVLDSPRLTCRAQVTFWAIRRKTDQHNAPSAASRASCPQRAPPSYLRSIVARALPPAPCKCPVCWLLVAILFGLRRAEHNTPAETPKDRDIHLPRDA